MSLQGTAEWHADRLGRATASEFSAVLAKGQGKTRANYLRRVVTERLTGKPADTFSNGHMVRGTLQEPHARLAYEAQYGEPVQAVGFIKHPTLMSGCSPDGLVDKAGAVECKSVIATVQLETILGSAEYPTEHKAQIQGVLWITGREWCDFVSYSADMPPHLQLYRFRVERDEAYIATLEREVTKFLEEVDALYLRLMRMGASTEELLRASLKEGSATVADPISP